MTRPGDDRIARAALTYLAEPADPLAGRLLQAMPPAGVMDMIRSGTIPAQAADVLDTAAVTELRAVLPRWQARLAIVHDQIPGRQAARGIELVCPGDPHWPGQLDDLGPARPYALWVRGTAGLLSRCQRSVAIIGSRAATAYGMHVGGQLAAELSRDGMAIVSGAAYGIDASAHGAALATCGITIAVLACGPDVAYPRAHLRLLDTIAARGLIISEVPPGAPPSRRRLMARNRIIVALATGTVVVEAAPRSGTMNATGNAADLGRPLMAVPGPVTSVTSEGCHQLIRSRTAACVTSAADIIAEMNQPS